MDIKKTQVTQDFLFQIITERGINVSTLAELMGMSATMVNGCFRHNKDTNGKPRNFPERSVVKLNNALTEMSQLMLNSRLTFGSEKTYTNNRGTTYDPTLVEPISELHRFFKLTTFLNRTLGWSQNKKSIVLHSPSSKGYACISEADVERINDAITEVAILLNSIEVKVSDGESSKDTGDNINKCTRTRVEETTKSAEHPWDNTSLSLLDRYRFFHEEYPGGLIFFRVNDGYTVAQDDSKRLQETDNTLVPYTDLASGMTTIYLSAEVFEKILPQCVAQGCRVMITNMYAE